MMQLCQLKLKKLFQCNLVHVGEIIVKIPVAKKKRISPSNIHESVAQFAKSRQEEITTGPFSTMEYFVLVNILEVGEENGLDMDTPTILHIYMKVQAISNNQLNVRGKEDIEYFQKIYQKNLKFFSQLCNHQLQCNLIEIGE